MRREDEDELANSMSAPLRANMPEPGLTDSKSVFAELPKMNEKPGSRICQSLAKGEAREDRAVRASALDASGGVDHILGLQSWYQL